MNNLHINQPQSTSVNSISYISRSQEKEWGKKGSRRKDLSPVILHRLYFTYNNNLLHLYSTFLDTQSALHSGGGVSSSTTSVQHPPGWCDGSHSAPERPPHTSLLMERRWCDEANQCMGMIRRPWWSEANGQIWPGCQGYTPTLYEYYFLMTTESQDLGLMSHPKDGAFYSIVSPSLHWGVRTHTDHRVSTPCWPH